MDTKYLFNFGDEVRVSNIESFYFDSVGIVLDFSLITGTIKFLVCIKSPIKDGEYINSHFFQDELERY